MSSLLTESPAPEKMSKEELRWRLKSLRAAVMGNVLEWFDWTLYATFAVYLAANFFEAGDPTSALLSTLAVFAVGFVARPIGGIVFGKLGDRIGRKSTLILTMITMAAASLLIAVIPNYETAGVWASALLLFARLLQGLAHGGESGVSYTYVAEISPAKHRGLWSSSVFISVTVGVMGATFTGVILTAIFADQQMMDFGWRIGFAIGALLGVYALYLRRSAEESPVFTAQKNESESETIAASAKSARLSGREIALIVAKVVMLSAASNAAYYTWVTFAPSFAISRHGMDPNGAFVASLLAQVVVLCLLPFFGHLADRFGRKPMVVAYGILVMVVVFPVNMVLSDQPWTLFVSQGLGLAVWAIIASIYPAIIAEQVPTKHRALGVGFLSSLSVAIFGGTAPYLNTWLTSLGISWVFSVWVAFLGLLAVVAGLLIRETKGLSLSQIGELSTSIPKRIR
ncbi:MFS transporter [Leifsonia sp. YAF41]|uniref:MFS transporter n=1 Tax=Leifsonia sp. YAF41 TaxID=3233086 RepID=UPI003F9DDED1